MFSTIFICSTLPPAIIIKLPVLARATPPETGASKKFIPLSCKVLPSCFVSRGSLEDISIRIDFVLKSNNSFVTCATILLLGSMKIITSIFIKSLIELT